MYTDRRLNYKIPLKSKWNSGMLDKDAYNRLYRPMQLELIVVGDFNGAT